MDKILFSIVVVATLCILFSSIIDASSCQDLVPAKRNWNKIKSPGFPHKFPPQTQCNWIIRAPPGYRLEVSFEAFYLIGGVLEGCFNQLLEITDLYSKVKDGPYCGNTLPPGFVSTGQSVRITLESNAVRRTLSYDIYYEGFKAQYRQTRKPSSNRFRDKNGKWRHYNVEGGEVVEIPTTTNPNIATKDPNEIDDNNNQQIDAQNNAINNQNRNENERVNLQNNAQNAPLTTLPPKPNRKRVLPVRTLATTTRTSVQKIVPKAITSSKPKRNNDYKNRVVVIDDKMKTVNEGLHTNSGIAITVAVVLTIIILLLIFIYFYCKRKRRKRDKRMKRSGKMADKHKYHPNRSHYSLRNETRRASSKYEQRHQRRNKKTHLPGMHTPTNDFHYKSSSKSRDERSRSREKRNKHRVRG